MNRHTFRYFHCPQFDLYNFGSGHAFNPVRQQLTYDLAQAAQLLPQQEVIAPKPADETTISLFHTPQFIEAVKKAGNVYLPKPQPHLGLGTGDNPLFADMHEATAFRVGASVEAVQAVIDGSVNHAANFSGGLHHALKDKASGFCIYNDIGVAIAWLRKTYDCKVAYIDLDAHHGDGVQWGFYDDPDVLTISIHESGEHLFPGTGGVDEIGEGDARGTSVNLPLLPYTTSDSWIAALEHVVPDVIDAFRPDIIITQHGCDAHRLDPLAHLSVSVQVMERATQLIHRLAHQYTQGRWVALGGGGYAIWEVVPRAWALVWSVMTERPVSTDLPRAWLDQWSPQAPMPLPESWYDPDPNDPPTPSNSDGDDLWRSRENEKAAVTALDTSLKYLRRRLRPM